jgi:hypothetical protein
VLAPGGRPCDEPLLSSDNETVASAIQRPSDAARSAALPYFWPWRHAFRLHPHARNWRRLRRRSVPWQREQTVEGLVNLLHPLNGKRTPDPNTVGMALITAPSSAAPARKTR